MLEIRAEQMKAFEQVQWDVLAQRLQDHLKEALPQDYEKMGPEAARALAKHAVERGRENGMVNELDFFRLFNLFFLAGRNFDQEPWAMKILSDKKTEPGARLESLEKEFRARGKGA